MGIQGLIKLVTREKTQNNFQASLFQRNVTLPPGSTLCLDSIGFLYWILDFDTRNRFAREFGGSYNALDFLVKTRINLLKSCGLNLVFFYDGNRDLELKVQVRGKRLMERKNEWEIMSNILTENNLIDHMTERVYFPLPPLAIHQFKITLRELVDTGEINVIWCRSEADQPLAKYCLDWNSKSLPGQPLCYCVGRDSDFYLMKDVPFSDYRSITFLSRTGLEIEDINNPTEIQRTQGPLRCLSRDVWRRQNLAQHFNLTETQFVNWSLLVGNDYTRGFDRSLFDFSSHFTMEQINIAKESGPHQTSEASLVSYDSGSRREHAHLTNDQLLTFIFHIPIDSSNPSAHFLEALLELIIRLGPEFVLKPRPPLESDSSSVVKQLNQLGDAIIYSQLLYDMGDLESFMADLKKRWEATNLNEPAISVELAALALDESVAPAPIPEPRNPRSDVVELDRTKAQFSLSLQLPEFTRSCFDVFYSTNPIPIEDLPSIEDPEKFISQFVLNFLSNELRSPQPSLPIDESHVLAFSSMLSSLRPSEPQEPKPNSHSPLNWTDCCIGHYFQELYKHASSVLRIQLGRPTYIFDGLIYHQELTQVRFRNTTTECVPIVTQPEDEGEFRRLSPRLFHILPHAANPPRATFPIDNHRQELLRAISAQRVTIIQGGTGCGKSTRLPIFLLEAQPNNKIFITQPRRIAVQGLYNRFRVSDPQKRIGMAMRGVNRLDRDTKLNIVTTGYLLSRLAGDPSSLAGVTHLIIDEVHERSLESDLIVWLARELLPRYPHLKLILMSATLTTELYESYFQEFSRRSLPGVKKVDTPASKISIFVGGRKHEVEPFFAEDLLSLPGLAQTDQLYENLQNIIKHSSSLTPGSNVPAALLKTQSFAVFQLIEREFESLQGKDVLVFVPGITDIERISKSFKRKIDRYEVLPVHSDIPIEDQERCFLRANIGKVRVIIATNAAESSLTLPNVKLVIDLGLEKNLVYDPKQHFSKLKLGLISKSSATQRAGRAGRVEPGKVFHLYSQNTAMAMDLYHIAEIYQTTLESEILLLLKFMSTDRPVRNGIFRDVISTFQSFLEPPNANTLVLSLQTLFENGMIDSSDGRHCRLTAWGRFASTLPIDITLSQFIIQAIALDLKTEAVVIAAGLSLSSSLYIMPNPIYSSDPERNMSEVARLFHGQVSLDHGLYSDPLQFLYIFILYFQDPDRSTFCERYAIRFQEMMNFEQTISNLIELVNRLLRLPNYKNFRKISQNLSDELSPQKLNRLRLLLAWSGKNHILKQEFRSRAPQPAPNKISIFSGNLKDTDVIKLFYAPGQSRLTVNRTLRNTLETEFIINYILHPRTEISTKTFPHISKYINFINLQHFQFACFHIDQEIPSHASSLFLFAPHLTFNDINSSALSLAVSFLFPESLAHVSKVSPEYSMIGPILPTSEQLVKLTSLMKEFTPSVSIRFGLQNTSLITYASESFRREVTALFRPITGTTSLDQLVVLKSQVIEFPPNERGLINNSPLGHQLIQFHCSGYPFREKVRGNFSWMKSMLKVRSSEYSEESPLTSKVSFKLPESRWSMFSIYPQGTVKERCDINRYTIPCVSAHFPQFTDDLSLLLPHRNVLYGCATTVFQSEQYRTASNVTLFPPGHRWMKLALLCQGMDFNESVYQFEHAMRNVNETETVAPAVEERKVAEEEVEDELDDDDDVENEDEDVNFNEATEVDEELLVASEEDLEHQRLSERDPLFSELNAEDRDICQTIFREFQENKYYFSLQSQPSLIEKIDSLFLPWIHQMGLLPSLAPAIHPANSIPPPPPRYRLRDYPTFQNEEHEEPRNDWNYLDQSDQDINDRHANVLQRFTQHRSRK